jgi:hypothetical protein
MNSEIDKSPQRSELFFHAAADLYFNWTWRGLTLLALLPANEATNRIS